MTNKISPPLKEYKTWIFVLLALIIFPFAALAPYLIHSSQRVFIVAASWVIPGCKSEANLNPVNQCVSWQTPSSINLAFLAGATAVLLIGIALTVYCHSLTRQGMKQFIVTYLIAAILIVTGTFVAHNLLESRSQTAIYPASRQSNGTWIVERSGDLGVGLTSTNVVLLSMLLIGAPLANTYRFIIPRYVGGQKKEVLFQ